MNFNMTWDFLGGSNQESAWGRVRRLLKIQRRLSPNAPQGGATVFLNHHRSRRKQKSFDISMLGRDSDEMGYLTSRARSPSPNPDEPTSPQNGSGSKIDFCEYVVEEILVTEQQYVRDLEDIVLGYLDCARKLSHITKQDVAEIFANIEDIYQFHNSFLTDLETCDEQPVAIAKCFIDRGTEFRIYAKYVTNYPSSISCLTRLLRTAVVNDAFRKQQLILGHGLPLGSYLHKPVQRILKYHLLLQNLLKHFPEDTFGRDTITTSLQCMTDCAHNINELKRSHEDAMKIQEIQSMLYNFEGYNLLDFGKLVVEGDLRMHGAKSFRHIYLFEKGIIICKKREDGAMSCKTSIMCHNLMLIESIPREPLSFHLVPYDNPRLQNTLQAKTLEQKRKWCSQIKNYILESYDVKIPDKAKELLLTLTGKSESDEKFAKQFKAFTLRAHQTPDYIEKKRRKSQPYSSTSAGETLPRTKKRVRKSSADPRMSLTSDLFMTPPTSRINRSMSNPVTSLDLNSSSPLLMRSITPTVAEEPDVLALDMSQSSLLDTHNSLHDPSLVNEINRPALAEFSIGCENNDNQSIVISSSPPISPINTIREELSDELTENSRHNENLSPRKNDNIVEVEETLSPEPSDSVIIPSVQITDTDDDDSRCSTLNDTTLALGASNDGAEHQVVPTPEEDECVHDIEGPLSAALGHSTRELYPALDSPSASPSLQRRHCSMPDLFKHTNTSPVEEKSHDELSARARQLHHILDSGRGWDNTVWCPEVCNAARRYSSVAPRLRRKDSYSEAQIDCLVLPTPTRRHSADTLLDCGKPSPPRNRRKSHYQTSQNPVVKVNLSQPSSPVHTNEFCEPHRKNRTETSALIHKLSQLKEMTSIKLSDLLKKSPVRLFKDSATDSATIDVERNDFLTTQSIVGRRLSHAEVILTGDTPVHHCASPSSHDKSDLPVYNACNAFDHLEPERNTVTASEQNPNSSDLVEIPSLPQPVLERDDNSVHSPPDIGRESRERSPPSKQGYSSDNLADIEEDEYTKVKFGVSIAVNADSPQSENQSAEDTTLTEASNKNYAPAANNASDDNHPRDIVQNPPQELPPLPEFLLRNRLTKTMSVVDDTLTSLDELSKELKSDRAAHRQSLPSDLKLSKPASDFWVALEKYMETGQINNVKDSSKERPSRRSEPVIQKTRTVACPDLEPSSELSEENSARKLSTGNSYSVNRNSKVYKMARKYSTRIKSTKDDAYKRLKAMRERLSSDSVCQEEEIPSATNLSETTVVSPTNQQTKRVNSIRLRRTSSSRIRKFKVMLDSDDENDSGSKADSGVQQCDFDSGSECNDLYERQTLEALESLNSDDEMRDSAIYSEGEESGITSPEFNNNRRKMSPVIRTRTLSPSRERQRRGKNTRHHSCDTDTINKASACDPDDSESSRRRKCKSLPRSKSLPSHSTNKLIISSVDTIISHPVSTNILDRLKDLKKSSTFSKISSFSQAFTKPTNTSVLELKESLKQDSNYDTKTNKV